MRIFGICVCVAALISGIGCERHSAQETKYFATHHLSKAEKAAAKEAYARQLAGEPAPEPVVATDPNSEPIEGRRFFKAPGDQE